ncbi:hypothetical protein NIES46_45420 [Arthrospira platensis NIES-46]|jgi:uncharacterized protein YjbI with pentapeptide repeats|uniref:Pentapeptide repeat-containing protein n=1 Tax=Limnospira platensis NIES-46 TaxID=1236695 RepID=A0A5M3TEG4_LIMPL|nr:pentapeptide repeat-containing protein [Arthrospira platensis]GCE96470.1 hypothetical protein NIES46_45420 [Arthrospira platensis NIES-46]
MNTENLHFKNLEEYVYKPQEEFKNETIADGIWNRISAYGSVWRNCIFQNIQFSNSSFTGCMFLNTRFINCQFTNINFFHGDLRNILLERCSFKGSYIGLASAKHSIWSRVSLHLSTLLDLDIESATFSECRISKSHIIRVDLASAGFNNTKFTDSKLIDSRLPIQDVDPAQLVNCSLDDDSTFVE